MYLGENLRPSSSSEEILNNKIIRHNIYCYKKECAGADGGKLEMYIGTSEFKIDLNAISKRNFDKRLGRINKHRKCEQQPSYQESSTPHNRQ